MAVKWFNIRTKETIVAESEPHIAAVWASSDHSPNITQGQDFGWRLAPEVVYEMKRIRQDFDALERIARRVKKEVEEVTEYDILTYISFHTETERAPIASDEDYQDEYSAMIRKYEREMVKRNAEIAKKVAAKDHISDDDVAGQNGTVEHNAVKKKPAAKTEVAKTDDSE